jgi:hypothetical protein
VGELKGQKKSGRTDSYLRRYDAEGNEVWTRQFGVGTYSEGRAIAASDSEVYVAGAARDDAYIRKFDSNGKDLWTRQIGTAGCGGPSGHYSRQRWRLCGRFYGTYCLGSQREMPMIRAEIRSCRE